MIITIDGQIATGKSTIAKRLAEELGYIYFDTGAMYRCLTLFLIKKGASLDDPELLPQLLKEFVFDIKIKHGERRYFVNKEDVTETIRGREVTSLVSRVSAIPMVREKLVAMQRQFSQSVNAVFEGRDMGTVVFPQADLKIFLTGRADVRAKRRFDELQQKFPQENVNLTFEQALEEINQRDAYDMNRQLSPLKKADDAYEVDTSDLTVDEVIMKILELKDSQKARKKSKSSEKSA